MAPSSTAGMSPLGWGRVVGVCAPLDMRRAALIRNRIPIRPGPLAAVDPNPMAGEWVRDSLNLSRRSPIQRAQSYTGSVRFRI
jgi:hypothetical protein